MIEYLCERTGLTVTIAYFQPAARLRGTNAYAVNGICPACHELHGRVLTAHEFGTAQALLLALTSSEAEHATH